MTRHVNHQCRDMDILAKLGQCHVCCFLGPWHHPVTSKHDTDDAKLQCVIFVVKYTMLLDNQIINGMFILRVRNSVSMSYSRCWFSSSVSVKGAPGNVSIISQAKRLNLICMILWPFQSLSCTEINVPTWCMKAQSIDHSIWCVISARGVKYADATMDLFFGHLPNNSVVLVHLEVYDSEEPLTNYAIIISRFHTKEIMCMYLADG